MKIGILTHHYVANFGAFLQAYCLREAVHTLLPDADARVIDAVNRKHFLINAAGTLRFHPKTQSFKAWRESARMTFTFAKARKRDLVTTKRVRSAEDINALGLDDIIVGSDEVFHYQDKKSFLPMKFGVGLTGARLIAYAPSVGGSTDFDRMPESLKEGLRSFSALSARDDNAERMMRSVTGKPVARVLDPVFLHHLPDCRTDRIKRLTEKPYVLFYHLGVMPQNAANIREQFHDQGLRVLGAGEYHTLYDEVSVDLTPFEMAQMFRSAAYVLTGTFHGVVLSLVNERPFSVCPNNETRAKKLASLLGEFGLTDRLTAKETFDWVQETRRPLDYAAVAPIMEKKRADSLSYLRESLT